jgi:outer membrane protein
MSRVIGILFSCFFFFSVFAQEKLTLRECMDKAIDNNIHILQSELDILRSRNDLRQKQAALFPSLNGMATHGYNYGNSLDYTTYRYVKFQNRSNYFHLGTQIPLFQGFSLQNMIRSGKYNLLGSEEATRKIKEDIVLEVAAVFLQILMSKEQIRFKKDQLELSRKLLERTLILIEVGQETEARELELKAQLANDELQLVDAENQLEQAFLNLKKMLNNDPKDDIDIIDPEISVPDYEEYLKYNIGDVSDASITKLPAVIQARNLHKSALYNYKAARALKYPTIQMESSLNTRFFSGDTNTFSNQLDNNFGQSIGFSLNIPIFNNLRNSSSEETARLAVKSAELQLREAELQARNEVYEPWMNLMSAYKKYQAGEKSLHSQKLFFEQSHIKYEEGMINFYEWQSAKNNVSGAENVFLSAKYDYIYRARVFEYYLGMEIHLE